jgi:hypothetical protein
MSLLLVVVPAAIGACGSIVSAYIAVKVRQVAVQTDGRMTQLESEIRLARLLIQGILATQGERETRN